MSECSHCKYPFLAPNSTLCEQCLAWTKQDWTGINMALQQSKIDKAEAKAARIKYYENRKHG